MATCREWYDCIPQFTKDNWKTLRLGNHDISLLQERNLGKHVKHVIFQDVREEVLSEKMEKLLDCGCDEIGSLGKILYRKRWGV